MNENAWISIKISLKYVSKGPINNIPALVQIMACHQPGNKPLSEPMMVYWRIYASLGLNDLTEYSTERVSKQFLFRKIFLKFSMAGYCLNTESQQGGKRVLYFVSRACRDPFPKCHIISVLRKYHTWKWITTHMHHVPLNVYKSFTCFMCQKVIHIPMIYSKTAVTPVC